MPYTKKTLSTEIADTKADLYSRFPTLDPTITNSNSANQAEVIAGSTHGLYDYLLWISKQPFIDTADDEQLDRHASNRGLVRLAAIKADGDLTFTGTIGSSTSTGQELVSATGERYTIDAGFTLTGTSEDHAVTAVTGGTAGNVAAAGVLSFVSTPSGMDSTATVASGALTGGTDRETDIELRVRIKATIANPPKGGSPSDYAAWAVEATAATTSWVVDINNYADFSEAALGTGVIKHYFVMDNTYSDGIPLAGDVTDVQDYIDPLKPAGKNYTVIAPTADVIPFSVTVLPNNATTQAAVEAEIKSGMYAARSPGGEITVDVFYEAMSRAAGLTSWTINLIDGIAPATITSAVSTIPTMGTVTFL